MVNCLLGRLFSVNWVEILVIWFVFLVIIMKLIKVMMINIVSLIRIEFLVMNFVKLLMM